MSLLEKVGIVGGPGTTTATTGKDAGRDVTLPQSIQDVEFRIKLNMAGDPSSTLPSDAMLVPAASPATAIAPTVDLRKLIKPALAEYRKANTEEMQSTTWNIIEVEREIEKDEERIEDLRGIIRSCEEDVEVTHAPPN